MFKYGVFIQLPNLGELKNSTILVQGCIKESVDDCVSDINLVLLLIIILLMLSVQVLLTTTKWD